MYFHIEVGDSSICNVFAISNAAHFYASSDWEKHTAYYFQGLDYRMLLCPFFFATDELLVKRPALYFKNEIPYAGIVLLPDKPLTYGTTDFMENLCWIVESYLFKLSTSLQPAAFSASPRFHIDYANSIPYHGDNVFDDSRVLASEDARNQLNDLQRKHSKEVYDFIATHQNEIGITNYAETTLLEQICSHDDILVESIEVFLRALKEDQPQLLTRSKLVKGYKLVHCSKKYHPTLLSFYMTAIKEPCGNYRGSYIAMYKNFYNILEYYMEKDGEKELEKVLDNIVKLPKLISIISSIKSWAHPQSGIMNDLEFGQILSNGDILKSLSETDGNLVTTIANRLYTKRCAALHSKKTHNNKVKAHIGPGHLESHWLETELAIIRLIAEFLVENAQLDD